MLLYFRDCETITDFYFDVEIKYWRACTNLRTVISTLK